MLHNRPYSVVTLGILLTIWGIAGLFHIGSEALTIVEYLLAIITGALLLWFEKT